MKRLLVIDRLSRVLYPALLVGAAAMLWRGHQAPGGGFIAGLIAVTASVLWAVAQGSRAARRRLPLRSPAALCGAGLLLMLLAGLAGVVAGAPYLTHRTWAGGVLSTAVLFDVGVALAVWGALATYVLPLLAEDRLGAATAEAAEDTP